MPWASQNSGILSARRGGRGRTTANWVRDFGMLDSTFSIAAHGRSHGQPEDMSETPPLISCGQFSAPTNFLRLNFRRSYCLSEEFLNHMNHL